MTYKNWTIRTLFTLWKESISNLAQKSSNLESCRPLANFRFVNMSDMGLTFRLCVENMLIQVAFIIWRHRDTLKVSFGKKCGALC